MAISSSLHFYGKVLALVTKTGYFISVSDIKECLKNIKKRGLWTEEAMSKAVNGVKSGNFSVQGASNQFCVPRRTLRRYLEKDGPLKKSKLGGKPTLTSKEETQLCQRIFRLSSVGYPLTPNILKLNVFRFCQENNIPNTFKDTAGRKWFNSFLKRNPEVARRKAQRLNPGRAQKLNQFIVADHFAKLKEIFIKYDFFQFPERVFNMDEKGCRLHLHKDPRVLAQKGASRVHIVGKEHGESVTVVACGNAVGSMIPPMILYSGVRKIKAWEKGLPVGSSTQMTPKGSMTTQTFVDFLQHFTRYKPNGQCILIFDGAKAHLDYRICEKAEKNDITLYCLPSNTTHELQPLDKSCFKSFETFWDQEVMRFFDSHRDENDITRLNFPDVFTPAWARSMTQSNMTSGFRATGIYPFNPNVIPQEAFASSTVTELPPPELNNHQSAGLPDINQPSTSSDTVASCGLLNQPTTPLASSSDPDDPPCVNRDDCSPSNETYSYKSSSSFVELLPTPKRKRKTTRMIRPAMNLRGIELKINLFQPKEATPMDPPKKGNSR